MELYRVAHLTFAYPNCEMKDLHKGMKEHKKPVIHDCSFRELCDFVRRDGQR